jgi:cell wall-associated NlpC family hydrolase
MTDVSSVTPANVQSVQSTIAQIQQSLASFGTDLADATTPTDFANLLSGAQDELETGTGSSGAGTLVSSTGLSGETLGANLLVGRSSTASGTTEPTGGDVVQDAMQYVGTPYQWGGTSPQTGFDCSGFVQYVYNNLGVSLPRTSQEQSTVGTPVASLADAQPGDLLFFEPGPSGPGHVGIYVGNGEMIDAPHTGTDVQVQPVWTSELTGIRQVVPPGPAGSSSSIASDTSSTGTASSSTRLRPFIYPGATGSPVGASAGTSTNNGVPASLVPLFQQAAAQYGLSPALLEGVAQVESGFNPSAVSSAGAQGLMQIMPSTAAGIGVDPLNPAQAIDGAAKILSGNLQKFGSLPLALAAYNAGAGAVEEYGGIPPYPETQAYVTKVTAAMNALGGAQ